MTEGAQKGSVGVGGSGVSAVNEGRGRKTGMPKLEGLLRGDGELSSSIGEKKSVLSPGRSRIELKGSGGRVKLGEANPRQARVRR